MCSKPNDKVKRREKLFGHFQVILIFLFKKKHKKRSDLEICQ